MFGISNSLMLVLAQFQTAPFGYRLLSTWTLFRLKKAAITQFRTVTCAIYTRDRVGQLDWWTCWASKHAT